MKLSHPSGMVIYVPDGQDAPDTTETLERDGLIACERNEHGDWTGTKIHDPLNIRVLCWQLTFNAISRYDGHGDIFKNLPVDLVDDSTAGNA